MAHSLQRLRQQALRETATQRSSILSRLAPQISRLLRKRQVPQLRQQRTRSFVFPRKRIEQYQRSNFFARGAQSLRDLVSHGPAERQPSQKVRSCRLNGANLFQIVLRHVLDAVETALFAV